LFGPERETASTAECEKDATKIANTVHVIAIGAKLKLRATGAYVTVKGKSVEGIHFLKA
jgi:hypothetical protein